MEYIVSICSTSYSRSLYTYQDTKPQKKKNDTYGRNGLRVRSVRFIRSKEIPSYVE